jgi:hypothetical protein
MRASLRVWFALAILAMMGRTDAQPLLTQRDGQGAVTVAVTLAALPQVGVPIRATVVLDTHAIALDGTAFERAVVLRTADEVDVAPTGVESVAGGGHHRQAVVSFPSVTQPGTVRIVVKNVGGIAERSFAWELAPEP